MIVQRVCSPAQQHAFGAEISDRRYDRLFACSGSDVLPVGAQMVYESDISHALAVVPFVIERIVCAFANGLPLLLTHSGHHVEHEPACRRTGIERFSDRYQSNSALFEALQQRAWIFQAPCQPIEFGDDDCLHLA